MEVLYFFGFLILRYDFVFLWYFMTAISTGMFSFVDVAAGAAVMAVFWVGTVPALAVVGVGFRRFVGAGRRPAVVASILLVLVGLWGLVGRNSLLDSLTDIDHRTHVASPEEAVREAAETTPRCCRPRR